MAFEMTRTVKASVGGVIAGILLALPAFVMLSYVHSRILKSPVVGNMKVTGVSHFDGGVRIRVVGDKYRECGPPIAISGQHGSNWLEYILFVDDKIGGQCMAPDSNPLGDSIDFGWWELRPDPATSPFLFSVFHQCGNTLVKTEFTLNTNAAGILDPRG